MDPDVRIGLQIVLTVPMGEGFHQIMAGHGLSAYNPLHQFLLFQESSYRLQ
jgi:hypothetical protein